MRSQQSLCAVHALGRAPVMEHNNKTVTGAGTGAIFEDIYHVFTDRCLNRTSADSD